MEYSPKPSVVVERKIPVAAFFASTLAPATTAPVASFTVPTRVAVEICAEAVKAKANTITATGTAIRIAIPLSGRDFITESLRSPTWRVIRVAQLNQTGV